MVSTRSTRSRSRGRKVINDDVDQSVDDTIQNTNDNKSHNVSSSGGTVSATAAALNFQAWRWASGFVGLSVLLSGSLHFAPISNTTWHYVVAPFFNKEAVESQLPLYVRFAVPANCHIFFGMLFFVLAWFQTDVAWRRAHLQWHRVAGWVAMASLIISMISLLAMVVMPGRPLLFDNALEPLATVAFALATVYCAAASLYYVVVARNIRQHRRFILRALGYCLGVGVIRVIFAPYNLLGFNDGASLEQQAITFGRIFTASLLIATGCVEYYLMNDGSAAPQATKKADKRTTKTAAAAAAGKARQSAAPLAPNTPSSHNEHSQEVMISFFFHALVLLLVSTLLVGLSWTTFLAGGVDLYFVKFAVPTFKGTHETFRIAHMQGITHAFLLICVGLVQHAGGLALTRGARETVRVGLLLEAYGFALGQTLIAFSGKWGLVPTGPFYNALIYAMAVVAFAGFLAAVAVLALAAWRQWAGGPNWLASIGASTSHPRSLVYALSVTMVFAITMLLSAQDGSVFDRNYKPNHHLKFSSK